MAKRLREDSISSQQLSSEAHTPKYAELDETEPVNTTTTTTTTALQPGSGLSQKMQCLLPPHPPLTFPTYPLYELHYTTSHTNRCLSCTKNFPTAHFLSLHISETHDPLQAAARERGEKTFACFVEGCDKVCLEWKKRRSHLVDKHGFPRNYDFFVVDAGIDGRRSMLRPGVDAKGHRKSSRERRASSSAATETTQASKDEEEAPEASTKKQPPAPKGENPSIDEVTKSMSALQFVPRSITFGKRKGKSGFAKS